VPEEEITQPPTVAFSQVVTERYVTLLLSGGLGNGHCVPPFPGEDIFLAKRVL
jgi:hypothetical protein